MDDQNSKKRKFLRPVEFAVAALLSVVLPTTVAAGSNGIESKPSEANII